ncbi:MAG: 30S ribosomal protein S6e [Candidatus Anstonellaceae archaeon]
MKMVISDPKTGKSYGIEIPKQSESSFIGKKIGDRIGGGIVGAEGYELEITGGSDIAGFPMRKDVSGPRRLKIIISEGPGYMKKGRGIREKRNVRGNIISDQIVQINTKVVAAGAKPLDELFPAVVDKKEKKN